MSVCMFLLFSIGVYFLTNVKGSDVSTAIKLVFDQFMFNGIKQLKVNKNILKLGKQQLE